MPIEIVLGIMCIVFGGSVFIGHAFGYNAGRKAGYKRGVIATRAKMVLNERYGKRII